MTDETLTFPCWRFFADGRSVLVPTAAEYARLDAGHVPWPGVFPQPWPPAPGTVPPPAPVDTGPTEADLAAARARLEEGTRLPYEAAHATLGPEIPDPLDLPDGGGPRARRSKRSKF